MIIDYENSFTVNAETQGDLGQAITEDAVSENVIDNGDPTISDGSKMVEVWVQVTTALVSAGNATSLIVALQGSVDAAFTTPVDIVVSGELEEADLVAGKRFSLGNVPVGALRFLRLDFRVGAEEDFTSGIVEAGLILTPQGNIGA